MNTISMSAFTIAASEIEQEKRTCDENIAHKLCMLLSFIIPHLINPGNICHNGTQQSGIYIRSTVPMPIWYSGDSN